MKNSILKKALIAAALCFCLIFSVACGGTNSGNGDWWKTSGELTKDEDGNVVFNNVEVRLSTVVSGDDKDAFNNIVARFNRLYEGKINVIVTSVPMTTYEDTVTKQINNNSNAPDLIMSHQKSHKNFAENHLIQPLDEAMEASGITIDTADYASGLAQYSSLGYEGKTFSIPIDGQSMVAFYNKEVLAKYSETLPSSRAELMEVCRKFKADPANGGKAAIAWATSGDYFANYVFTTALLQNGVKLFNESDYKVDWSSNTDNLAAFKQTFTSFRELFNNGYANFNEAASAALTEFMGGQRLFYFTLPWSMDSLVSRYAQNRNVTTDVLLDDILGGASVSGWFAMTDNANKNAIYGDSHFFAMTKNVTDVYVKAAVLEFVRWFTTDAQAGKQWARAGHVSMSNAVTSAQEYTSDPYVTNFINAFYPNVGDFRCVGATPYYEDMLSNLQGIFADTVGKSNATETSDEQAVADKQKAVNDAIDFFGKM